MAKKYTFKVELTTKIGMTEEELSKVGVAINLVLSSWIDRNGGFIRHEDPNFRFTIGVDSLNVAHRRRVCSTRF